MKVLITGTAGFIGFHLANKMLEEGFIVDGYDNINDYYDVNLKFDRLKEAGIKREDAESWGKWVKSGKYENYQFMRGNLEDKETLLKIFEERRYDFVVNLAAQAGVRYSLENPQTYVDSNITGFLNILEACRFYPVKHLFYASSSSVYGSNTEMPFSTEHKTDSPISLYAASKKANELMAHAYGNLFGIKNTGLRFFTVYGPWGRPDMALFLFAKGILNEEEISVFNNGEMERDFTYIDDIVQAIYLLLMSKLNEEKIQTSETNNETLNMNPETGSPAISNVTTSGNTETLNLKLQTSFSEVFNIGNNAPVKLMDFIHAIEENTGKDAIINYKPMQSGDVSKSWADVVELYNKINFKPNINYRKGVSHFLNWFIDYFKLVYTK